MFPSSPRAIAAAAGIAIPNHQHSLHNFCKQPQQSDFRFKISGFLAAIKLTDKSEIPDIRITDIRICKP